MCHITRGATSHQSWMTSDQSSQIRLKPKQRGKSKSVLSTSVGSEREGKPRRYAPSGLNTVAWGDAPVNDQLNSGPRMKRCISRLLVTIVAFCGVGETRLHSSKIVFPPTQIGPLDNPFSNPQATIHNPPDNPFNRLDSIHSSKLSYNSKVNFPEQEMLKIPTREEFDSLVHFPAKSDVEDPIGNKMMKGKTAQKARTRKRKTKQSTCGPKRKGQRIISCKKTKKGAFLHPRFQIFAWSRQCLCRPNKRGVLQRCFPKWNPSISRPCENHPNGI